MKKKDRVKSNVEFNSIIQKGTKIKGKYFTIFYIDSDKNKPRFGIAAPKKIGNAVIRNKMKRQVRQIVDETKLLFKNNKNYIIIIRDACLNAEYSKKVECMKKMIGELNEK